MTADGTAQFRLSDRQWQELLRCLRPVTLPLEAKALFEQEIAHYLRRKKTWSKPSHEVTRRLAQAGHTALKLVVLLENLSEQEQIEFHEARSVFKTIPRLGLREVIEQLKVLNLACVLAPVNLSPTARKFHRAEFFRELDKLLNRFTTLRVGRSKGVVSFLESICQIAGDNVGRGGIESTLRHLRTNGEIPSKPIGKKTAQITGRRKKGRSSLAS